VATYDEVYRRSVADPEGFWREAAAGIDWVRPPDQVLDQSRAPFVRWFPDGVLNTCANAVDRHVEAGRGEQAAIVYDSPVTNTVATLTYRELRGQVARFAGVLAGLGVTKGDRVLIYLPMVPEAAIAMLACARLGAIHSVVFGGFAAHELAIRIDDAAPKVIVSASGGIEVARVIPYKPLLDLAITMSGHKPEACVILQRPFVEASLEAGRDHDWSEAMAAATPHDECVPVAANDPLYVLYTSGTTGKPKGVVRDNGGHAVALRWSMPNIYGVDTGDVFWAASDVGWVVGHSYIVYAPLLAGCTTVLYEGKPVGTPDPGAFWRVIALHGVKALFTAPTAFRAIKKEDPKGAFLAGHDLSRFETLFLAGERLDPDTYHWAVDLLGIPVIDHWWQTETGWPIAANCMGIEHLPVKPGSPTKAVPGYQVAILDEAGQPCPPGREGAVVVKLPLPPGCLPTLWNDDERFVRSYLARYDGYYLTGDGGLIDQDGYLFVMGRVDDVINVAGHRLSTGAMEEVIATHPDVAECAVVGVADELKGQVPMGFVVLKAGVDRDAADIQRELVALMRERVGAVASFRDTRVVARLPKTRSGKILRATMRAIADDQPYQVPSTIDDPAILDEIAAALDKAPQ
jgi:propionyl-CoA synthetase